MTVLALIFDSLFIHNHPMPMSQRYLRHLLLSRSDWMEHRLYDGAARHGYGDMTPAMSRMCGHLADGPLSLSELARRLAVSRQAVHRLAADTEALGYVECVESKTDARLKLLRFTDKGRTMAAAARGELEAIEAQLAQVLGPERLAQLMDLLALPWTPEDLARTPHDQIRIGRRPPPARSARSAPASATPASPARRPKP
jgi:DNA-binding MarR family transcriptional regulator